MLYRLWVVAGGLEGEGDKAEFADGAEGGVAGPGGDVVAVVVAVGLVFDAAEFAEGVVGDGGGGEVPFGWAEGGALEVEEEGLAVGGVGDDAVALPGVAVDDGFGAAAGGEVLPLAAEVFEAVEEPGTVLVRDDGCGAESFFEADERVQVADLEVGCGEVVHPAEECGEVGLGARVVGREEFPEGGGPIVDDDGLEHREWANGGDAVVGEPAGDFAAGSCCLAGAAYAYDGVVGEPPEVVLGEAYRLGADGGETCGCGDLLEDGERLGGAVIGDHAATTRATRS
jgi:hypothetical protein